MDIHRIGFTDISSVARNTASPPGDAQAKCNVIFIHGLKGHPRKTWGPPKLKPAITPKSQSKWKNVRSFFRATSAVSSATDAKLQKTETDDASVTDTTASGLSSTSPSIFSSTSSMSFSSATTADSAPSHSPRPAEDKIFWPADLLAQDLPQARIWTYGYNADVLAGMFQMNNKNSVSQHGRDLAARLERDVDNDLPIIFVAHSLGGIVVKDALHRSETCRRRTKYIVFLGTPHRGSACAGWGEIASNLARLAGQDPNSKSLKALDVNSEVLDNIHEEFKNIVHTNGIKIHTFQEARGMPVMKGVDHKVVDDVSSKADLPRSIETVESIDADHMQMVKCGSKSDDSYRAVYGVIRQFILSLPEEQASSLQTQAATQAIPDNLDNRSPSQPIVEDPSQISKSPASGPNEVDRVLPKFLVPYNKNPDFIERTNIMMKLREQFGHGACTATGQSRQRVALHGLGGVGKTQIALSYVYWLQEYRPDMSVFWVHASSIDRFRYAYANIAKECNIPDSDNSNTDPLELVKAYLESQESAPWMLVIDNADDAELFFRSSLSSQAPVSSSDGGREDPLLGPYIPSCGHGSVLITTRNKAAGVKLAPGKPPIEVEKMDDDEAGQLIQTILLDSEISPEESTALASKLEFLPICIAQAAAFILENSITIGDYMELLDDNDQTLVDRLSEPFETMGRDSEMPHAVAATWMISFNQIRRQCVLASDFLSFICLFSRQAIPKDFVLEYYDETRGKIGAVEKVEIAKAFGVLKAFSFISEAKDKSVSIHRLVQLVTRKWLLNEDKLNDFASQAVYILSIYYPDADHDTIRTCANYMPHVQAVLQFSDPNSDDDGQVDKARILHNVGTYYVLTGQHELCLETQRESLEICQRILGRDHDETLGCQASMADILSHLGKDDEAEKLQLEVLQIRIKKYGPDHTSTLISQCNLASLYQKQGRYDEAEALCLKNMAQSKRILGESHTETLDYMEHLARLYINLDVGRFEEGADIWESVVETRKRTDGPMHASTLTSMSSLARAYERLSKYQESFQLMIQVYEYSRTKYGVDHVATIERMGRVADLHSMLGRPDLAQPLRAQQYEFLITEYGIHHPEAERASWKLAHDYSEMGRFSDAEKLSVDQLERYKAAKGLDHRRTIGAMENLATIWAKQGWYARALELGEDCLERSTRTLGSEDFQTQSISDALEEWKGWQAEGYTYVWATLFNEEYAEAAEQFAVEKISIASAQHRTWGKCDKVT